jgi:uncharacterized protein YbjT (DUF2867 family)
MKKVSERLILVTGANGCPGGAVLQHVRARGFPVRILTRDQEKPQSLALVGPKTEIVQGDFADEESLKRAADGAFGVSFVHPWSDAEIEVDHGIKMIEAARLDVVDHFLYISAAGADENNPVPELRSNARIEAHLANAGLHFTVLRPVFYMEKLLAMRDTIENGMLAMPFKPDTRLQMIAIDDVGVLAKNAFDHRGHWLGRALDIAGDELSMSELAQSFSHAFEREVKYRQIPWEEFEQQAGPSMTRLYQWIDSTGYRADIAALRAEYPNLSNFRRWLNLSWLAVDAASARRPAGSRIQ